MYNNILSSKFRNNTNAFLVVDFLRLFKPAHTGTNGIADINKNGNLERITTSVTAPLEPNNKGLMGNK
jgi:hypothetical protein